MAAAPAVTQAEEKPAGGEWDAAARTRLDIPVASILATEVARAEATSTEPQPSIKSEEVQAVGSPALEEGAVSADLMGLGGGVLAAARSAFERIGAPLVHASPPPMPAGVSVEAEADGADDLGRHDTMVAMPIVRPATDAAECEPGQYLVRIGKSRESYSQRRLWEAEAVSGEHHYVVEERRLLAGEDPEVAVALETPDPVSSRFIFGPLSRFLHDGRVLTLYPVARGQSVEAWRRTLGREAATPRAILNVLRPIILAVAEMHRENRVHLQINPRTVWLFQGNVGFTGADYLEPLPVERSRFRATLGFSAPEVFGRSKQSIDKGADIYSLGAMAYFLVAGVIPPVAPETAYAPAVSPRDFRPTFPVGWTEAILRATDPVPGRRFATAEAFLEALTTGYAQIRARSSFEQGVSVIGEAERHIGYSKKKRSPVNQDQVFFAQDPLRRRVMMAVADGVSTATYGSGDLASGFLIRRVERAWALLCESGDGPDAEDFLTDIINGANRDICEHVNNTCGALAAGPAQVMGSTALVAYVEGGVMTLASLGDSRCYIVRSDLMECLTRDHNLFTLSLVEGLNIEDVLAMSHGDALARCLGTFDTDQEGFLVAIDPPFDIYRHRLLPGDNVLLCSDGLFDYAGSTYEESESNIRRIVLTESHPGIACLELILLANRGGGGDNIGVALMKVGGEVVRGEA